MKVEKKVIPAVAEKVTFVISEDYASTHVEVTKEEAEILLKIFARLSSNIRFDNSTSYEFYSSLKNALGKIL